YQLRLRNIGGIIIIDFIDMDKGANREKVFKTLQEALAADRAKTNVLKISDIGLVEMTRKRVRESITRLTTEICPTCDGRGHVRSKTTMAYGIMRSAGRAGPRAAVVTATGRRSSSVRSRRVRRRSPWLRPRRQRWATERARQSPARGIPRPGTLVSSRSQAGARAGARRRRIP